MESQQDESESWKNFDFLILCPGSSREIFQEFKSAKESKNDVLCYSMVPSLYFETIKS